MRFVISSTSLSSRFQAIGKVIIAKNNLPSLENFLFEIVGQQLTLTASDSETTIKTTVDLVESDKDCRFMLNAKTIQDALKEIPEQPLAFYINESSLEITIEYQNGKYNLVGQDAQEYPQIPELPADAATITVASDVLYSAVNRALFATADDELRPVMNGVFFDIQSDLTIVASDGHKLVCSRLTNTNNGLTGSFILPKKPAGLLRGILAKEQTETSVRFTDRNAEIIAPNFVISCRLIEGHYPNYGSVIPQDNANVVTINRPAFLSALRRVLVFATSTSLIKLTLGANQMNISGQDLDYAMSAEENVVCDYSGMPMNIGFKGTFLLELLNNLECEDILLKLADSSRAGIITPVENKEGEDILMLLMPMMLND